MRPLSFLTNNKSSIFAGGFVNKFYLRFLNKQILRVQTSKRRLSKFCAFWREPRNFWERATFLPSPFGFPNWILHRTGPKLFPLKKWKNKKSNLQELLQISGSSKEKKKRWKRKLHDLLRKFQRNGNHATELNSVHVISSITLSIYYGSSLKILNLH